jgi:hypothetical protein
MKRPQRTKVATGVYQDAYGYEVIVVKGSGAARLQSSRRFPADTKLAEMTAWWRPTSRRTSAGRT